MTAGDTHELKGEACTKAFIDAFKTPQWGKNLAVNSGVIQLMTTIFTSDDVGALALSIHRKTERTPFTKNIAAGRFDHSHEWVSIFSEVSLQRQAKELVDELA